MAKHDGKLAKGSHKQARDSLNDFAKDSILAPIIVEWRDHQLIGRTWIRATDCEEACKDEALIVSVGWPVFVDDDVICIAQSVGGGDVGEVLQILRSCVVNTWNVKPGKPIE